MPEEKRENFFTELLKLIAIVAVIVIPVRLFVAQPFIVSGESMHPTFEDGQYLIVDELSYRFGAPARGDVIVFQPPNQPKGVFYIKRIIGLPGETVRINTDSISIKKTDGTTIALAEPYVKNQGNGAETAALSQGEYFVMGDNRTASSDSRVWGALPRSNIIGRAFARLLPPNAISIFPGAASY